MTFEEADNMSSKSELIEKILDSARRASKQKNVKKRENGLRTAKLHLQKSTEKQVEDLWARIEKEGAENVFK